MVTVTMARLYGMRLDRGDSGLCPKVVTDGHAWDAVGGRDDSSSAADLVCRPRGARERAPRVKSSLCGILCPEVVSRNDVTDLQRGGGVVLTPVSRAWRVRFELRS